MNDNHYFMDSSWKKIPKEKIDAFCGILSKLTIPPKNFRCMNLYDILSNYIQDHTNSEKAKTILERIKQLNRIEDIPKTKGRLCGGLLGKGQKAYKCYNCMTEDNSVLCEKCFELQKHIGHDFERFDVHGGCCDCGDVQKWKEQGFCAEHSKDEEIEIVLDEKIVNLFLQEQLYGLQLLLEMYSKFEYFQQQIENQDFNLSHLDDVQTKLKKAIIDKAAKIIDLYGGCFIDQLIQFNKAGKFANAMTDIFFKKELQLPTIKKQKQHITSNTVFLHLFSMIKLKITPQKMVDLCITMFPMVGFRETVTEVYITLYNEDPEFAPSAYSHLSSQLLTSYMVISKLIKQGRMNALKYQPICKQEKDIQRIAEGYLRYYYDIRYLSKLYGDTSLAYLKLHGQQRMFYSLGYYRIIVDKFQRAIDYYGLDEIFLERMIPLVNVIRIDKSNQISNMALRQLYKFITSFKTSSHNKYRPQERLFTLLLFVRLNGNLSVLDDSQQVEELFSILGVENFQEEAFTIITNLCSVFKTASELIEGGNAIHHFYTFYNFYLKKSQLLFNLDAILFKIMLKMCQHYQKAKPFFDYRAFILLKSGKNPYFVIEDELDQGEDPAPTLKAIRNLKNYVSLVLQAIFSDLPILSVSCALDQKDSQRIPIHKLPSIIPRQLTMHYYQCLLRAQEFARTPIKTFKKGAQLFFKEQEVFKAFVERWRDPVDQLKLLKREEVGLQVNCLYFRSICSIPAQKYKTRNYAPAYMKWKKDEIIDVFLGLILSSTNFILKNMYKNGQINQQIANCKLIPELMIELWKITVFSTSQQSKSILQNLLEENEVKKEISYLSKQLLTAIHCKEYQLDNLQQKRKQEIKKKLQDKKALLLQKMNKNTEKILQSQSCRTSESTQMKAQNDLVCCLCKEVNSEHLYLLGFMTFTSGNGWLGIDTTKNLIPIFDSCGHAVHRECYTKIMANNNLNRLYLNCPLCKKATNILLPECENMDALTVSHVVKSIHNIYATLEIPWIQSQILDSLYYSLLFEFIFKGLTFPQEFAKNIKVYQTIYQVYTSMAELYGQNEKQLLPIGNQQIVFKVNAPAVYQDIANFVTSVIRHQPSNVKLSQGFIDRVHALLGFISRKQFSVINGPEPSEIHVIKSSIVFPNIQQSLASLNQKYRGKCLQCGLITNNQMICLNCSNFVTCTNCTKSKLTDHSQNYHAGLAAFIRTSTGQTSYIMRNRYWKFQSLYEDYMGRVYEGSSKPRQDYNLNLGRLQEVKRDVLLMKIEQKVRLKQFETKKVFHQQIN